MQIGLVIYDHLDVISGGYLYDRKLVEFWRRQDHEVIVLALPARSYGRHLVDNFFAGVASSFARSSCGCSGG